MTGRRSIDGRLAVDLFSGTGQATAAFARHGWRVVTVDWAAGHRRRPYVVADVRALPIRPPVDFLWASPPCTEFSDANPVNRTRRPSLDLIFATLAAVADLRPRYWILENVRGAIPYLGVPVQKIGPWCLWGYFPPVPVRYSMHTYQKAGISTAVARAAIPGDVAEAVYQAVDSYWAVHSLLDLRPFRRHRHKAGRSTSNGPRPELLDPRLLL